MIKFTIKFMIKFIIKFMIKLINPLLKSVFLVLLINRVTIYQYILLHLQMKIYFDSQDSIKHQIYNLQLIQILLMAPYLILVKINLLTNQMNLIIKDPFKFLIT